MTDTLDDNAAAPSPLPAETGPPPLPVESPPPPAPPAKRPSLKLAVPFLVVWVGMALIALFAEVEENADSEQPWVDSVLAPNAPMPTSDAGQAMPVYVRRLPLAYSPAMEQILAALYALPQGDELVEQLGLKKGENVVFLPIADSELKGLLASGRLPEPGKPEALAGDLATRKSFVLDMQPFEVVGKLKRGVGALAYAYVIPESSELRDYFVSSKEATRGWLDPEGMAELKAEVWSETGENGGKKHRETPENESAESAASKRIGGMVRALPGVSLGVTLGLILVAAGGAWAQFRIMRRMAFSDHWLLGPALREVASRPRLFLWVNVALFGAFFGAMFVAFQQPVMNARFGQYVSNEFMHGDLSYIGKAYASREIVIASAATFAHNYLFATVLLTILPSFFIPFFGFIKNFLTFGSVGFVMAPLWAGHIAGLIYHCITMTLELEAYVVASFIVVVFPIRLLQGIASGKPGRAFSQGVKAMISVTALSGIMLAIAAVYEAVTIITLK